MKKLTGIDEIKDHFGISESTAVAQIRDGVIDAKKNADGIFIARIGGAAAAELSPAGASANVDDAADATVKKKKSGSKKKGGSKRKSSKKG